MRVAGLNGVVSHQARVAGLRSEHRGPTKKIREHQRRWWGFSGRRHPDGKVNTNQKGRTTEKDRVRERLESRVLPDF